MIYDSRWCFASIITLALCLVPPPAEMGLMGELCRVERIRAALLMACAAFAYGKLGGRVFGYASGHLALRILFYHY